tara:strand:- start:256 stop:429 length:174 start_codon:yes stop_codon:yes gene_type:complete
MSRTSKKPNIYDPSTGKWIPGTHNMRSCDEDDSDDSDFINDEPTETDSSLSDFTESD